ncbi:MAG: hypothetical protein RLZZ450_5049 [Pseudomonadota bacterium]|jgi:hypothetical protein
MGDWGVIDATRRALLVLSFALLAGCGGDAHVPVLRLPDECEGHQDGVLCSGSTAFTCSGGHAETSRSCAAVSLLCASGLGCKLCEPGRTVCNGAERSRCAQDGNSLVFVEQCASDLSCGPSGCSDLCADASKDRSYLGCEYWPVFTSNSQLDARFTPAVAVGNGNLVAAHVVISKGGLLVRELDVPAHTAITVELAFQDELKNGAGSRLVRQGAYHLRASVPVTVHQYNALLFELDGPCANPMNTRDGVCNSFTNDASLLFPATALSQDAELTGDSSIRFLAASRPTFVAKDDLDRLHFAPGFVAIAAVGDKPVAVRVTSTAFTAASDAPITDDAGVPVEVGVPDEPIEALAPGGVLERTLMPGDVLQLRSAPPDGCAAAFSGDFCDPGPSYDLTGTEISADGAIEVISGHDCSNVPYDVRACDHLEDALVPLHAWGKSAVTSSPQMLATSQIVVRVISGADANLVTFDPPVHEPVTLARAQAIEFTADKALYISGTAPLMVAQYLIGQGGGRKFGDPSLSIAVPVGQYRSQYTFVSPSTYPLNYVDIVALPSDVVTLDGEPVSGFVPVGSSRFTVATVRLTRAGSHEVRGSSALGLGIVLYGFGPYTSYMLPGGLDLAPLTMGI